MKIVICSSLDFTQKIEEIANQLRAGEHEVLIPRTAEMILQGELCLKEIMEEKKNGKIAERAIRDNIIKRHFEKIKNTEAILVLNLDKRGIKNYIGGSVFLEMGFAHILNKKIFLLNSIPDMPYTDEIRSMQPIILKGNLDKIS